MVYDDWFSPVTNFLKPAMNAIIFAMHALFGNHYNLYFLTFFVEIIAGAVLLRTAAIRTGSTPGAATVVGLLFLINPAIVHDGLVNISFQNDFLAGFFVLATFYVLLREWYAATLALLLIAVFTKESTWFAPIAASMGWALLYRNRILAAGLLAPLPAVFALRSIDFGGVFSGAGMNPPGLRETAIGAVKGLMLWPLGTVDFELVSHPFRRFDLATFAQMLFLFVNVAFWCALTILALKYLRPVLATSWSAATGRASESVFDDGSKRRLVVLIFLLGALSFGVLAGQLDRYGSSIYTFLLLSAGPLLGEVSVRAPGRSGGGATWIAPATRLGVAVLFLAFVYHGVAWARLTFVDSPEAETKMHRALTLATQRNESGRSVRVRKVYVVNAPDTFSSPRFLSSAWGLPFETVYINQFFGCEAGDAPETELAGHRLVVHVPDCARILFRSIRTQVLEAGMRGPLQRSAVGEYHFDKAMIEGQHLDPRNFQKVNFGNTITVDLVDGEDAAVLAYSFGIRDYRWIDPGPMTATLPDGK
jgi:hypothetical protein